MYSITSLQSCIFPSDHATLNGTKKKMGTIGASGGKRGTFVHPPNVETCIRLYIPALRLFRQALAANIFVCLSARLVFHGVHVEPRRPFSACVPAHTSRSLGSAAGLYD